MRFITVHLIEFMLAVGYVIIKWPFFVGSDFFLNYVYCFIYLSVIALYFTISSIIPAMKIACQIKTELSKSRLLCLQLPWVIFTIIVFYCFKESLGSLSCLPIILPNGINLVCLVIFKDK